MKKGDMVKFVGTWGHNMTTPFPKIGVVTEVWTNGQTQKTSSVDVIWDVGIERNVLAHVVEVINESR